MLFRLVPVSPERGEYLYFVDMSSKSLVVWSKMTLSQVFLFRSLKACYPSVVPPMVRNQVDSTVLKFPEPKNS